MRKWVLAASLTVLLIPAAALPQQKNGKGSVYEQLNLFSEAFERIRQDAVEPVADQKLIETAIAGMLSGLDARSAYISEAAFRTLQASAKEDAGALGLVVTIENGQLKVISVRTAPDSSSAACSPTTVTTGTSALRKACRSSTPGSLMPRARAASM